jgi:hypothetical protein
MCERGQTAEVIVGGKSISVDSCLADVINNINESFQLETRGCCCGHGKYEPTIVVWDFATKKHWEWFSGEDVPRQRNFYYKDSEGIFHLPECPTLDALRKSDIMPHGLFLIAQPTKPSQPSGRGTVAQREPRVTLVGKGDSR